MSDYDIEYITSISSGSALSFYYCGQDQCRPGYGYGPTVRPHYLFHYIISGKGTCTLNHVSYPLEKGQGFLIFPGETAYYQASETDPWSYCWFSFSGSEVPKIIKDCGLSSEHPIFQAEHPQELQDAVFSLFDCFENKNFNDYMLLSRLYEVFSWMKSPDAELKRHSDQSYAEQAKDFISNHYSYSIKIQDIADFIRIDRTYLYRIFMQETGCSPQQYLIRYRLDMACSLLKNTGRNITEIAYSCGFKDAPSFYKRFKQVFSLTPLQYRNHFRRI